MVRPYHPKDREAVRRISVATAFMGRSGTEFIDGEEFLADLLTRYFTDFESESLFVAEHEGRVVGYITGAVNTLRMEEKTWARLAFPFFLKAFYSGFILKRKNLRLLSAFFLSLIRGEFWAPLFVSQYPATLHINLEDGCRGTGLGRELMETYLAYLFMRGVKGVRLASMSETAFPFFERHGFQVLHESSRSYFRHILGRDITVRIYGRLVVSYPSK